MARMLLLLPLLSCAPVFAVLRNFTVDDRATEYISYVSNGAFNWNQGPCDACFVQPDANQVFHATWHEGLAQNPGEKQIIISFQGVAIYVYMVTMSDALATTALQFTLDGESAGNFSTGTLANKNLQDAHLNYNVSVFNRDGLQPSNHTLNISSIFLGDAVSQGISGNYTDIVFDYFIYTKEDGVPGPNNATLPQSLPTSVAAGGHSSVAAITGGVIAGVVVVAALIAFIIVSRRRKPNIRESTKGIVDEFSPVTVAPGMVSPLRMYNYPRHSSGEAREPLLKSSDLSTTSTAHEASSIDFRGHGYSPSQTELAAVEEKLLMSNSLTREQAEDIQRRRPELRLVGEMNEDDIIPTLPPYESHLLVNNGDRD